MASQEKNSLNLKEPEDAQAWLDAFKARCRAEKRTDATGDLQMTDQFLVRCGIECLKKVKSLLAPQKIEEVPFNDIEKAINSYLQPQHDSSSQNSQNS